MNKLIQQINRLLNHIVRKQSLSITPDGRFICSQGGKKYIADSPLDGLTNDKKWKRIK